MCVDPLDDFPEDLPDALALRARGVLGLPPLHDEPPPPWVRLLIAEFDRRRRRRWARVCCAAAAILVAVLAARPWQALTERAKVAATREQVVAHDPPGMTPVPEVVPEELLVPPVARQPAPLRDWFFALRSRKLQLLALRDAPPEVLRTWAPVLHGLAICQDADLRCQALWLVHRLFAADPLPLAVQVHFGNALRSVWWEERAVALEVIVARRRWDWEELVEQALRSPDPREVGRAARTAGRAGAQRFAPLLGEIANRGATTARCEAAIVLDRLGDPVGREVLVELAGCSETGLTYPDVAAQAFQQLEHSNDGRVSQIARCYLLHCAGFPGMLSHACDALVRRGIRLDAVDLKVIAADPDPLVKCHASYALAAFGDPVATAELVQSLEDPDPAVRREAFQLLSRLDTRAIQVRLTEAIEREPDAALRDSMREMLKRAADGGL